MTQTRDGFRIGAGLAWFLGATIAVLCISAASAGAATPLDLQGVHVETSFNTDVVTSETKTVESTVSITTGDKGFVAALAAQSPAFERFISGHAIPEGDTLPSSDVRVIEGEWRLESSGGGLDAYRCNRNPDALHPGGSAAWIFRVKAHSSLRIAVDSALAPVAPWLGTHYAPTLFLVPPEKHPDNFWNYRVPRGYVAVPKLKKFNFPQPLVNMALAGRVDFDISPKPQFNRKHASFRVRSYGSKVVLKGELVPPTAGQTIKLSELVYKENSAREVEKRIANVTTDANGKFSYDDWHPSFPNSEYGFKASYPRQTSSDLFPDPGCRMYFHFGKKRR